MIWPRPALPGRFGPPCRASGGVSHAAEARSFRRRRMPEEAERAGFASIQSCLRASDKCGNCYIPRNTAREISTAAPTPTRIQIATNKSMAHPPCAVRGDEEASISRGLAEFALTLRPGLPEFLLQQAIA